MTYIGRVGNVEYHARVNNRVTATLYGIHLIPTITPYDTNPRENLPNAEREYKPESLER